MSLALVERFASSSLRRANWGDPPLRAGLGLDWTRHDLPSYRCIERSGRKNVICEP